MNTKRCVDNMRRYMAVITALFEIIDILLRTSRVRKQINRFCQLGLKTVTHTPRLWEDPVSRVTY